MTSNLTTNPTNTSASPDTGSLVEGRFTVRQNRFAALVEVDGTQAKAHVPNSGRMAELLVPGARALLRHAAREGRRTAYDLVAVWHACDWVGLDARMPPRVVIDAWHAGHLPMLAEYETVRREVVFGSSRLDLRFEGPSGVCYVEAKSVNLVEDGIALFPDAPTTRGVRHLGELRAAIAQGHRAAVAFVVQRPDAGSLAPHPTADPVFTEALRAAVADGVTAVALRCRMADGTLEPLGTIPVVTGGAL